MKIIKHSFEYQVYQSLEELSLPDMELLEKAHAATATAYAPYSRYHVGAAVKLTNGFIIHGSNQENMSFPAGLCAERVAVFAASSQHPGVPIETIAISAKAELFEVSDPVPPCGMCRQAIVEYEMKQGKKIRIILGGEKGRIFVIDGMENLLPLMFHEKGLVKP
jgi:cytidine deaminase